MRAIRATVRTLLVLIRSWFHVDQIRISPFEGRLLSLQPGQRILLREHIYVVSGPPIANPANMREVAFRLDSEEGPAYLTVQRTLDGNTCSTQLVDHHGQQDDIFDDDVALLPSEERNPSVGPTANYADSWPRRKCQSPSSMAPASRNPPRLFENC